MTAAAAAAAMDKHPAITNAQNVTSLDRCNPPLTAATPRSTQHKPLPQYIHFHQVAAAVGIKTGTTAIDLSQT